jgi:hypothetical protein
MQWRVWVLVAVLGGAVAAGAFLLPHGSESDSPLADAARRTLAGPGYRMTIRDTQGGTGHEDYQAPDRIRITSSHAGDESEMIAIGDTLYGHASCSSPAGSFEGYATQHLEHGARTVGTGTGLLLEAAQAKSVNRDRTGTYEFAFRLSVPKQIQRRLHLAPVRVEARVDHGRVRSFLVHWRQGKRGSTTRATFTFGRVPVIEPPSGPAFDPARCGIGATGT